MHHLQPLALDNGPPIPAALAPEAAHLPMLIPPRLTPWARPAKVAQLQQPIWWRAGGPKVTESPQPLLLQAAHLLVRCWRRAPKVYTHARLGPPEQCRRCTCSCQGRCTASFDHPRGPGSALLIWSLSFSSTSRSDGEVCMASRSNEDTRASSSFQCSRLLYNFPMPLAGLVNGKMWLQPICWPQI